MKHLSVRSSVLFRRLFCLALCLVLGLSALPAAGDRVPEVQGLSFDLRLHLNADQAATDRSHLRGYASLLEALRFQGTVYYHAPERLLDLCLDIIPLDSRGRKVDLHLSGYPDLTLLSSSLLGDKKVLLSNASLLEFAVKAHEHLGLSLQYAALLVPYVYEYAFRGITYAWEKYFPASSRSRTIPAKTIRKYAEDLKYYLTERRDLDLLISAIGIGSDASEVFREELLSLPDYLTDSISGGKAVTIRFEKNLETWSNARQNLLTHAFSDSGESVLTDLPATAGGYTPFFRFSREDGSVLRSTELEAAWGKENGEELFRLQLAGDALPLCWPVEAVSHLDLSVTGRLFPQLHMTGEMTSDTSGNVSFSLRWSEEEEAEHYLELTGEGLVEARTFEPMSYTYEQLYAGMDILRANDATLAEFTRSILRPAAQGLLRFLVGIPASACQSLMDDLTEAGILELLLSGL